MGISQTPQVESERSLPSLLTWNLTKSSRVVTHFSNFWTLYFSGEDPFGLLVVNNKRGRKNTFDFFWAAHSGSEIILQVRTLPQLLYSEESKRLLQIVSRGVSRVGAMLNIWIQKLMLHLAIYQSRQLPSEGRRSNAECLEPGVAIVCFGGPRFPQGLPGNALKISVLSVPLTLLMSECPIRFKAFLYRGGVTEVSVSFFDGLFNIWGRLAGSSPEA